jgi:hypothetical protein
MNTKTDNEMLCEILDRARRTETRVVKLGEHMGVELADTHAIEIGIAEKGLMISVSSFDITLSRLIAAVKADPKFTLVSAGKDFVLVPVFVHGVYEVTLRVRV